MTYPNHRSRAWEALQIGPRWQPRQGLAAVSSPGPGPVEVDEPPVTDSWQAISTDWDRLRTEAQGCHRCALSRSRREVVFGVGDRHPDWVVVGEAPGAEEDRRGEPFVGEAGQLLDAMLASVGMSRTRGVFILNVLKCRPPGNRDPAVEEVHECSRFLHAQLALLAPRLVLALGRFAAHTLLQTDEKIGTLRQRAHHLNIAGQAVPLVVSYHPAYLLRSPAQKRLAWQDLCAARLLSPPLTAGTGSSAAQ